MSTVLHIAAVVLLLLVGAVLLAFGAWTVFYVVAKRIKDAGVPDALDELAELANVPLPDRAAAARSVAQALQADNRTTMADWLAPLVVAMACIGLSKTATRLPRWARRWDNNISINGDGLAVLRDGHWVTLRDGIEALPGERVVTYDDLVFTGPVYFKVLGVRVRPRTWFARWGWAGLRNRASQLSVDMGVQVAARPVLLSGDLDIHAGQAGHFLLRDGDNYHFKSVRRVRVLGIQCALIRSVGYKLEHVKMRPDHALGRAAAVAIGYSLKRWKGEA